MRRNNDESMKAGHESDTKRTSMTRRRNDVVRVTRIDAAAPRCNQKAKMPVQHTLTGIIETDWTGSPAPVILLAIRSQGYSQELVSAWY
ncbi:hypothetical protein [Andreprevotia lacus]|uniref:hypothetical protein n=1 Tax=Andreprevotia lacus TaxID=1121000 RepID=UPI00111BCF97|nr:hypothetical protein [Andreprevotia lacus]